MTDAIRNITIRGTLEIDTTALAKLETSAAQRSLDELSERANTVSKEISSAVSAAANQGISRTADEINQAAQRTVEVTESVAQKTKEAAAAARERAQANRELADELRNVNKESQRNQTLLLEDRSKERLPQGELFQQRFDRSLAEVTRRREQTVAREVEKARQENFFRLRALELAETKRLEQEKLRLRQRSEEERAADQRRKLAEFAAAEDAFLRSSSGDGARNRNRIRSQGLGLNETDFNRLDRTGRDYDKLISKGNELARSYRAVGTVISSTTQGLANFGAAAALTAVALDETQSKTTRLAAGAGSFLEVAAGAGNAATAVASLATRGVTWVRVATTAARATGLIGLAIAAVSPLIRQLFEERENNNRALERGVELDRELAQAQERKIRGLEVERDRLTELNKIEEERSRLRGQRDTRGNDVELDRARLGREATDRLPQGAANLDRIEAQIRQRENELNRVQRGSFNIRSGDVEAQRDSIEAQNRLTDEIARLRTQYQQALTQQRGDLFSRGQDLSSTAERVADALARGQERIRRGGDGFLGARSRGELDERGLTRRERRTVDEGTADLQTAGLQSGASIEAIRKFAESIRAQQKEFDETLQAEQDANLRATEAAKQATEQTTLKLKEFEINIKANHELQAQHFQGLNEAVVALSDEISKLNEAMRKRKGSGGQGRGRRS